MKIPKLIFHMTGVIFFLVASALLVLLFFKWRWLF